MEHSDVVRRDVVILYGEDAGEWSVYLKDEFLQHLDPEGVCSFQIDLLKDLQTAAHTLADYRCKFLVLTSGLLESLDNPRSQLLSKVLLPPATVVLLLCGVPSSDDFYKVLPVQIRFKEVSAEQETWEYVSMVISIAESDPIPVPELKDLRSEMEVTEDLTDVLVNPDDFTEPLLVMPTQIPCENVTKIFLFLKDHLSLEGRPEVEFVTGTQQIKVQASMLNSQTVCVRSVDLPAGPVILKLHCRQALLGSAQVIYFSQVEKIKFLLLKVTDPIQFICQAFQISTQTQLDELLTKSLQNSLPSSRIGAFQSIGTNNHSPPCNEKDYECPTLIHFAAKNGLERLTALLLDCPGAKQASALLNSHGERPGEVAKRYGFQHIHKLMNRFMTSEFWEASSLLDNRISRYTELLLFREHASELDLQLSGLQLTPENEEAIKRSFSKESTQRVENQYEKWLEPSQGREDEDNIYEKMTGLLMAANKFEEVSKSEEIVGKEDPYTLSMGKEDQYMSGTPMEDQNSTVCPNKDRFSTAVAKEDCSTTAVDEEDPYTLVLGDDDCYTTGEDRYTTVRPKVCRHTVEFDNNDYTTVVSKKDHNTTAVEEEDPYILVLGDDDHFTTVRPKEDRYAARPEVQCHTVAISDDRYTTVVRKKHHYPAEVDGQDPYTLTLEDLCTTAVPKGGCYTMAEDGKVSGIPALDKEGGYGMVKPKEDYTAAVTKRDCYTRAVMREDRYTRTVTGEDHHSVDDPSDYILPQRKSSSDARKESRPPAPVPRPVVLSEAPSTPFIAQVFQQKTSRDIEHIYGIMARDVKTQRDREDIYSLAAPMRQAPGPPKLPHLYDKLPHVR